MPLSGKEAYDYQATSNGQVDSGNRFFDDDLGFAGYAHKPLSQSRGFKRSELCSTLLNQTGALSRNDR
jgi:hypothetical protein